MRASHRPAVLDTALAVGELERALLAELIHDDVLQALGAGLLVADTCERAWRAGRTEMLQSQFSSLRSTLEQSVDRLRELMADLRPYQPSEAGLEGALQPLFVSYRQRGGAVTYQQRPAHLPSRTQALAYRLIVEAVGAVHDQPGPVEIDLNGSERFLDLDLSFRPSEGGDADIPLLTPKRIELIGSWLQALGGALTEEPIVPVGTRLRIHLPLG